MVAQELARNAPDAELLAALAAHEPLRDDLLANPSLTHDLLVCLIGESRPGRPTGDPDSWCELLTGSATWLTANSDLPDPGGFEAAELRECGPAGGRLFGRVGALCGSAAEALGDPVPRPDWVEAAITWALECAVIQADPDAAYRRAGVSPKHLTSRDIPDLTAAELHAHATALRELRAYGDGGYGSFHTFAIVALLAALPMLDEVTATVAGA